MEACDAVHQVRRRVFALKELHATAENVLASSEAVEPDVRAVNNRVDLTAIQRRINALPEGLNKRVAIQLNMRRTGMKESFTSVLPG